MIFLNFKLVKKKVKNKIELFKNDKSSKSNKIVLGAVSGKNANAIDAGTVMIKNKNVITNIDLIFLIKLRLLLFFILFIFFISKILNISIIINGIKLYKIR